MSGCIEGKLLTQIKDDSIYKKQEKLKQNISDKIFLDILI